MVLRRALRLALALALLAAAAAFSPAAADAAACEARFEDALRALSLRGAPAALDVLQEADDSCSSAVKNAFLTARLLLLSGEFSGAAAAARLCAPRPECTSLLSTARDAKRAQAEAARLQAAGNSSGAWAAASAAVEHSPLSVELRLLRAEAALALGLPAAAAREAAAALQPGSGAEASARAWLLVAVASERLHVWPACGRKAGAALEACARACADAAPQLGPACHSCMQELETARAAADGWKAAEAASGLERRTALLALLPLLPVRSSGSRLHALLGLCEVHSAEARAVATREAAAVVLRGLRGSFSDEGRHGAAGLRWCTAALAAEGEREAAPRAQHAIRSLALAHRGWAQLAAGADVDAARRDAAAAREALTRWGAAAEQEAEGEAGEAVAQRAAQTGGELRQALVNWPPPPDLYTVLALHPLESEGLSAREWSSVVRKAFRRAALDAHPDKEASRQAAASSDDRAAAAAYASRRFRRLADAARILSDARLKELYDTEGTEGEAEAEAAGPEAAEAEAAAEAAAAAPPEDGEEDDWHFVYDKRDVALDGSVEGAWVSESSGRRRPTRHTPPVDWAVGEAVDEPPECPAGRQRCLASPATAFAPPAEEGGRVAEPVAAEAPLQPQPQTQGCSACAAVAKTVTNPFGLLSAALTFFMPEAEAEAEGAAAQAVAAETQATLRWEHQLFGPSGLALHPGDFIAYELKWGQPELDSGEAEEVAGEAEEGEGEEAAPPPPPPAAAAISLDLAVVGGGALLRDTGAADTRGYSAAAETDLRSTFVAHSVNGWLERRIRVSVNATVDALLLNCAYSGPAATVRASVRYVRLVDGSTGHQMAVLLPNFAPGKTPRRPAA